MKRKVISREIAENRAVWLKALRSGEYPKGPFIQGQDSPPKGAIGFCAIGLPYTLFMRNKGPVKELRKILGLKQEDICTIQNEWNDSSLTFPQIADLIEHQMLSQETPCQ